MGQIKNNGAAENLAANRNYKSTVFAMLFGDRESCWDCIMLSVERIIRIRKHWKSILWRTPSIWE